MFKTFISILLAVSLCVCSVGCAASGPSVARKPSTEVGKSASGVAKVRVPVDDGVNFGAGGSVEASDVLIMAGLVIVGGALLMVMFFSSSGGTSGGQKGGM